MKKNILFNLLMLFMLNCYAQRETKITYFDSQWNKVSKSKASYYRESYMDGDTLRVTDYYLNGTKQMTGSFADPKGKFKHGFHTYYDIDGEKTSEGNYFINQKQGNWVYFDPKNIPSQSGTYIDDKREGEWLVYFPDGVIRIKKIYQNDSMINAKEFNALGTELTENDTFICPQVMPEFEGGFEEMARFLSKQLHYPFAEREMGIEGRVLVQFIVDKNGQVGSIETLKSATPSFDAETIRVLKSMPAWKPGMYNNKPVAVRFTLPVVFRLN